MLFQPLLQTRPLSAWESGVDVAATWVVVNLAAFVVLYGPPLNDMLRVRKLNPAPPTPAMCRAEALRSFGSLLVAFAYDRLYYALHGEAAAAAAATGVTPSVLSVVLPMALGVYFWGDAHFYWVHRLQHVVPWLYKNVHKVHHESTNPNPLSGLSFHPVESVLYFSSLVLWLVLGGPAWAYRLHRIGLIVTPTLGHAGFDAPHGTFHWIHHTRDGFNFNFGSSIIWDTLMGTLYPHDVSALRAKMHMEQQKKLS